MSHKWLQQFFSLYYLLHRCSATFDIFCFYHLSGKMKWSKITQKTDLVPKTLRNTIYIFRLFCTTQETLLLPIYCGKPYILWSPLVSPGHVIVRSSLKKGSHYNEMVTMATKDLCSYGLSFMFLSQQYLNNISPLYRCMIWRVLPLCFISLDYNLFDIVFFTTSTDRRTLSGWACHCSTGSSLW